MKSISYAIVLLLSLVGVSSACSMSCCAGNEKCCCTDKSAPIPHSQKTDIFSHKDQPTASSADGCSCRENAPQPFTESQAVTIQNNPSSKDGSLAVSIFKNTRLSTGNFAFEANHSPPNGYNCLTIPIPLRI